ncbi:MAG: ABC transporter permease, partial [Pseudomonadota bacterium]|nr:ABC transporter permease [Pseudomonadota bacterium]
ELFAIGFGAGTVIGVIAQFVPAIGSILKFPLRMLYFMSGVFYLPESMVPAFRDVIAWNPVMHGISLFREGYFKFYDSNLLDREYLAYWAISSVLAAMLTTRVAQKPLRGLP